MKIEESREFKAVQRAIAREAERRKTLQPRARANLIYTFALIGMAGDDRRGSVRAIEESIRQAEAKAMREAASLCTNALSADLIRARASEISP